MAGQLLTLRLKGKINQVGLVRSPCVTLFGFIVAQRNYMGCFHYSDLWFGASGVCQIAMARCRLALY